MPTHLPVRHPLRPAPTSRRDRLMVSAILLMSALLTLGAASVSHKTSLTGATAHGRDA